MRLSPAQEAHQFRVYLSTVYRGKELQDALDKLRAMNITCVRTTGMILAKFEQAGYIIAVDTGQQIEPEPPYSRRTGLPEGATIHDVINGRAAWKPMEPRTNRIPSRSQRKTKARIDAFADHTREAEIMAMLDTEITIAELDEWIAGENPPAILTPLPEFVRKWIV